MSSEPEARSKGERGLALASRFGLAALSSIRRAEIKGK
jgi:hypothetical protein